MPDKIFWKIQYVNLCINAFAKRHKLSPSVSFRYLSDLRAIDFIDNNYEAEHIMPIDDTVDALTIFCRRNGGSL